MLGIDFSFETIIQYWKVAIFGTSLSALIVTLSISALAVLLKAGIMESAIIGITISLSSTAVALKCLGHDGTMRSYGSPMISILVAQDILLCILLALFPSLSNQTNEPIHLIILILIMKISAIVLCCIGMHFLVFKYFLRLLCYKESLEDIFSIGCVCVCFLFGKLSEMLGISMELGCFFAGISLGLQKNYVQKISNRVRPIAELFAILFFNSIGLHMNPRLLVGEADVLLLITIIVVALKFFTLFILLALIFRYNWKTASMVSLGLAHISEFAFVIAGNVKSTGYISREVYYLIVGMTSISLFIVPILWKILMLIKWLMKPHSYSEILNDIENSTDDIELDYVDKEILFDTQNDDKSQ